MHVRAFSFLGLFARNSLTFAALRPGDDLGPRCQYYRSPSQVAAIRRQREQAAAAQQQADMEARMMESMAKVGNVRTQGTVAGEVMGRPQEDDA